MTAVILAPPILARQVGAILIGALIEGDQPGRGHTWRWQCTCGAQSKCTFPTAGDADLFGQEHVCREVSS